MYILPFCRVFLSLKGIELDLSILKIKCSFIELMGLFLFLFQLNH